MIYYSASGHPEDGGRAWAVPKPVPAIGSRLSEPGASPPSPPPKAFGAPSRLRGPHPRSPPPRLGEGLGERTPSASGSARAGPVGSTPNHHPSPIIPPSESLHTQSAARDPRHSRRSRSRTRPSHEDPVRSRQSSS